MAVNMEIRREASRLKKKDLWGLVGDGEGDDRLCWVSGRASCLNLLEIRYLRRSSWACLT